MSVPGIRTVRLLHRRLSTFPPRHLHAKPRSNTAFLLGTAVGVSVGLATSLYITNYLLPRDPAAEPKFGGKGDLERAIAELQRALPDRTSVDEQDRIVHGSSSWFPVHDEGVPDVVVCPTSTAEVQQIARIATRYRIPIVSYGAGTSIEGQFSPPHGGICVDFGGMDEILEIQGDDMTVTLQPGVSWQTLNAELDARGTGLFFPVDPGPGATIGGCIGTSCSGPNAARYGTMKEGWVVNMTVVTADGRAFQTRSAARKSSTGYDLTRLMIGAEGTLGLVTAVTLRLTNKPARTVVGTCAFRDVADVTRLVLRARREGVDAQCLELLDADNMPAVNAYSGGRLAFPRLPHLFFRLSGTSGQVDEAAGQLARLCRSQPGASGFQLAASPERAEEIWGARKDLLAASLAMHGDRLALSTDVCVPISRLPDLVARYRAMSDERGVVSSILGHVADGNFHSLILYRPTAEDGGASYRAAKRLGEDLLDLALGLGGTVSGEHGVGSTKRGYMLREYGPVGIDLMQRVKDAWDPHGLLNPGKLLPDRRDLVEAKRLAAVDAAERA